MLIFAYEYIRKEGKACKQQQSVRHASVVDIWEISSKEYASTERPWKLCIIYILQSYVLASWSNEKVIFNFLFIQNTPLKTVVSQVYKCEVSGNLLLKSRVPIAGRGGRDANNIILLYNPIH